MLLLLLFMLVDTCITISILPKKAQLLTMYILFHCFMWLISASPYWLPMRLDVHFSMFYILNVLLILMISDVIFYRCYFLFMIVFWVLDSILLQCRLIIIRTIFSDPVLLCPSFCIIFYLPSCLNHLHHLVNDCTMVCIWRINKLN